MKVTRPNSVRVAGPGDERAILRILKLAHEENAVAPFSEGRVIDSILKCTRPNQERGYGIAGVVDGPNGLQAIGMSVMCQWWYTHEYHIEELCNFVHPEHRRSNHAKDLIQFNRWLSESLSLPLFMGILTDKRLEAKIRLYQRQMPMRGAMFTHNLNYGGFAPEEINDHI